MPKYWAIDYKRGGRPGPVRALKPAALLAVLGYGIANAAASGQGGHGQMIITCTNPFSGASWQVRIDYDRSTVDSNPARIRETEISWRDASDGRNYSLDRKSGKLTVVVASATGGNFLYDRCDLAN
jgi:hypothetical protein